VFVLVRSIPPGVFCAESPPHAERKVASPSRLESELRAPTIEVDARVCRNVPSRKLINELILEFDT